MKRKLFLTLLAITLLIGAWGLQKMLPGPLAPRPTGQELEREGSYYTKDEVAQYIHLYGELPANFITKAQAMALGWEGGSLAVYAPGKSIGGDVFKNLEGLLPAAMGRTYFECDINTPENSRGPERLVFSSDGLIYYTADHYSSFTLLYGERP